MPRDRADVVATAILAVIRAHLRRGRAIDFAAMRAEITTAIQDEIDDAIRQARGERELPD
jgi:hypothetical protein